MVDLCEPRDIWEHLPKGTVANPGRLVALIDPAADAFTLGEHNFADGDVVRFRADAGAMPAPLGAGTAYYTKPIDDARFQVAATSGGDAIDVTSAGRNVLVIAPVDYAAACRWASRIIEDMIPAHAVPFTSPVPPVLRLTAAEFAALKVMSKTGSGAPVSLTRFYDEARKRVERWATGVPIRDADATEPANLSASASSLPYEDRRGWSRYGGL